jgi:hypothetical protein
MAFSLLLGSYRAVGQVAESVNESSVECISLARVTRTEVVDEQTIRFHMRGRPSYSNYLPSACPGLDGKTRFTYETANSRLCSRDTITLLEGGSRLTPGITCRLGRFVAAAAEEVVDLTHDEHGGTRRNAIEVRRVELPAAADAPAPPAPPVNDAPAAADGAAN